MSIQPEPAIVHRRDFPRNRLPIARLCGGVRTYATRPTRDCINDGICFECAAFDNCLSTWSAPAKQERGLPPTM
jgi:hypothetical protein